MTDSHMHSFTHEAMATAWSIRIAGEDFDYARSAAQEAWELVDCLETELSKFQDSSGVSRIREMPVGSSTLVTPSLMECLTLSAVLTSKTCGCFDPTLGTGMHRLELDMGNLRVTKVSDGLELDLGGMGKGYALDQIKTLFLEDWEVESALLNAGNSTLMAMGRWPVNVRDQTIALEDRALSTSGFEEQGYHIIDPRNGEVVTRPVRQKIWVQAESAAVSDALSTAFMLMSDEDIGTTCESEKVQAMTFG